MAYKYNSFSGKVSSSNPISAYNPTGLTQTTVREAPPIEWAQKPSQSKGFLGRFSNRVAANQALYGAADGVPIHMKLPRDRIGMFFAMAATAIGTVWTCYSLVGMSVKK